MRLPLLLLLPLALTACGGPGAPLAGAPVERPQEAVREGDRVVARAVVVAVPGRPVRLCANAAQTLIGYAPGQEPAPAYCALGVDVEGVDLAALSEPRTKEGASEGRGRFEGVWRDGVFVVERQEPDPPQTTAPPQPPDRVPCPAPDGGWPAEGPGSNLPEPAQAALQAYLEAHPEQVSWLALRRPAPGRIALAVGVHDAAERAEAERLLRPGVGDALCLLTPRTTDAQLAAVGADPLLQAGSGQVHGSGTGLGQDMEPVHGVDVTVVTPALREAADRHPGALVEFRPTVVRLR